MAPKRGLGRGLDALIPESAPKKKANAVNEKTQKKEDAPGSFRMIDIKKIQRNADQPRKDFNEDALEELADSIRQFGVLEPLVVVDRGSYYMIVVGERRWRAAMKAGLKEVPASVQDLTDQEIVEIALIENLQREDLNEIEEALTYKRLMDEFHMKQDEIANRVSKSRTAITNSIRLLKLCEPVQRMIIDDKISSGHARAIISIDDPDKQLEIAETIFDQRLSVREVEKLIRKLSKKEDKKKEPKIDKSLLAIYSDIEENLKQHLSTKVAIVPSSKNAGAGRLEIDFYSHEDLERLMNLLNQAK